MAIAIAMLHHPHPIIADEPITALDVTIQGQLLHAVQQLCRSHDTALSRISHGLSVATGRAERACIPYTRRTVEQGGVGAVTHRPRHPDDAPDDAQGGSP